MRHLATLLVLGILTATAPAQLRPTAIHPTPGGFASPATRIAFDFATAIDPTTVTPISLSVYGRWSGPHAGTRTLENGGTRLVFATDRPYFPGEMVTVTVSSALGDVSGATVTEGMQFQFWVLAAASSGRFTTVQTIPLVRSGESGIGTYGIYAGDVDKDGSPDITAMNEGTGDIRVLKNDGCGRFGPMAVLNDPNGTPSPSEGADFNHDGWLDIVVGNYFAPSVSVFLGDGAGYYLPPVSYGTGRSHGVTVLDANGDGYADVVFPANNRVNVVLNLGDGSFGPETSYNATGSEDNVVAVDMNGDGWLDIVTGNRPQSTVAVLLRTPGGAFNIGPSLPCGGNPFSICAGDLNGDGNADVVVANRGTDTFGALFGDGTGNLGVPMTYAVGSNPAAIDLGDLDGDGDLDVVVSNFTSNDYTLYWNDGTGTFVSPSTLPASQNGSCATLVDWDRDGDVDIIGTDEGHDVAILFRQDGPNVAQVQAPRCSSALRVNGSAAREGFGGRPRLDVAIGETAYFNVSGAANAPCLIAFGAPQEPGLSLPPLGLLNLSATFGVGVLGSGVTDGFGEWWFPLDIPTSVTPGSWLGVQAVVVDPSLGGRFSNPAAIVAQ